MSYSRKTIDIGDIGEQSTRSLMDAANRLAAEAARLFPAYPGLVDQNNWMATMIDQIPDYVYAKDLDSRFMIANRATVRAHGFSSLEQMVGKTDFDMHAPQDAEAFYAVEQQIMTSGEPMFGIEEPAMPYSRNERWLMTSKLPLRDRQGRVIGLIGVSRDITERRQAEALHAGQARLLEAIAVGTPGPRFFNDLILLIEAQMEGIRGSILFMSADRRHLVAGAAPTLDPAYTAQIDGVAIGPMVGSCGTAAYLGEQVIASDLRTDPRWADYVTLVEPYGFRSCWSTPIRSSRGEVLGTFALYADKVGVPDTRKLELISIATHLAGIAIERCQAEERIRFLAHHDALTGLPNRHVFEERFEAALSAAHHTQQWVVLAFVDLDNFKLINDSLGHKAGDELLKIVASRAGAGIRRSDLAIRHGGDEFILLLTGIPKDMDLLRARLEKIRAAISAPMVVAGRTLQVTCSMGVAFAPDHGRTSVELLANADFAMYRAKAEGRDGLVLFDAGMSDKAQETLTLQEELRQAVATQEFVLHYQPQVNLATGTMFACESLVRWQHPKRGLVGPGDFIPAAEETGLIVPIGEWILNEACRQNKAWQTAGLPPIVVSVNVSARQFRERNFATRVAEALVTSGLEARYLELELTESLIMQDMRLAIATMHQLEALGVQLAIDDFGTGYSSLSALKSFPVSRLKIDRSFIQDIPGDRDDMAITSAIISLAHNLQMRVIAEGVETQAQADFLRRCGCEDIQGYLFSKPLAAQAFEALLRQVAHRD